MCNQLDSNKPWPGQSRSQNQYNQRFAQKDENSKNEMNIRWLLIIVSRRLEGTNTSPGSQSCWPYLGRIFSSTVVRLFIFFASDFFTHNIFSLSLCSYINRQRSHLIPFLVMLYIITREALAALPESTSQALDTQPRDYSLNRC